MKKIFLFVILIGLIAFKHSNQKGLAMADQKEGVFIFIRSKPVNYEFVGKINMPEIAWKGKANEMINVGIKRCKKQYPEADGIIFTSENLDKAEAVKLKE